MDFLDKHIISKFEIDIDPNYLRRFVELSRIIFGLILTHRFINLYGMSVLWLPGDFKHSLIPIMILASIFLSIGFLTPIAITLLAINFIFQFFAGTLGSQVALLMLYLYLFAGAGQTLSVDGWIKSRFSDCKRIYEKLYFFAIELTTKNFARLRCFALFVFWLICYNAVLFHFFDPLWIMGKNLHLHFGTPYLSDFYMEHNLMRFTSATYSSLLRTGMYVQGVWELFLFPLMFFRMGRVFIGLQGFAFFAISAIFMNLGYLPVYELVLWALLFLI
ncbi:MAG: hypothetical protein R2827_05535 [Bdellovibrionales bacterium]